MGAISDQFDVNKNPVTGNTIESQFMSIPTTPVVNTTKVNNPEADSILANYLAKLGVGNQAGSTFNMGSNPGGWTAFGGTDPTTKLQTNSIVGTGLNIGQMGLNAYLGLQQLGIAKDNLNFQKDSFSKQFEANKNLTNSQLADRQKVRLSANPNHQSVESYMAQYGIK